MENYKEKQYICDVFKKLIEIKNKDLQINKSNSLKWKIKSLQTTLNILSSLENDYIKIDEIKIIKGIGKGGIIRIEEIMNTGYLKEIQDYEENIDSSQTEFIKQIEKLESISGIGNIKANKLFKDNITFEILIQERLQHNIKNFKENKYLKNLTKHQFICLKYYEDISFRIPRKEIEEFDTILLNVFSKIDDDLVYEICGSYRRKNSDSGDIDILFCNKNCKNYENLSNSPKYLQILLKELKKMNIIVENLTNSGDLKYMGICKIPGHDFNRRLDIKYVPYCSYIPGLLHFTGSYKENIRLRQIGKEKKYKINEYGVYKIKEDSEELIILNTEKELYDILNEKYKSPEERN